MPSKKPKLSIYIPAWNQEKLVLKALDSIPRRDDIEVLVWDDGSTDGTCAALERYKAEHPELKLSVFTAPNTGYNIAKNNLLDRCKGEYVHCLDSDDWLITGEYEKAIGELDGTDVVCIDLQVNDGTVYDVSEETRRHFCGSPCRFIRRAFIGDLRFIADRQSDRDFYFNEELIARGATHKYTHIVCYHYNYPRAGSLVDIEVKRVEKEKRRKGQKVYKNIFYFPHINDIGGVETMYYTLARKYGADHDITILYRKGAEPQLERLRRHVRVIQIKGNEHFVCEKMFFNFNLDIMNQVEADEYYLMVHADLHYGMWKPPLDPRITKYFGVSKTACQAFTDVTGVPCELVYNPYVIDKPRKILHLISATRLTAEKGKKRMEILGQALTDAGIPYQWLVFTNDTEAIKNPNIIYCKPRLDIIDYIADADYLVQLSDTEAFAYSMVEALSVGTPVIVTDFPSATEMGVKNGVNGFILPFDMSEIPLDAIYKGVKKFKYTPPADQWGDILAPGEPDYTAELSETVLMRARDTYIDMTLGRELHPGDLFETQRERADMLVSRHFAEYVE